jgi:hypothetical protein
MKVQLAPRPKIAAFGGPQLTFLPGECSCFPCCRRPTSADEAGEAAIRKLVAEHIAAPIDRDMVSKSPG